MKKILSLVLALVLVLGCVSLASAEEGKIKLVVWSFTNELQGMIEKYYAPNHPEIEFEFQIYPTDGGEYTSKVDNLLAVDGAAADAPDIFTLEAAFVKHYTNGEAKEGVPYTADLKEVGFTDEELSTAFPIMAQIGQDPNGVQKGLSWQSTPGALMYRASLAEKYLGITDPEAFQEKVEDWDAFLETAKELKEASAGACKMVCGSGDIWNAYQYQRAQGWVVDGTLVIDNKLQDYLDLVYELEVEDLTQKAGAWGETWFAGMRGDIETLCYFLPTWGLHYTLKPNCVAGADGSMSDEELKALSDANGGTYGDWRMVAGPVGYSWGGTWMGANAQKLATADDAKKAAIKDIIYFFTLNEDFLTQYAADSGDFVGSAKAVETILANGGTPNPFLGGQDHYAIFAEGASLANGSLMTEYDEKCNTAWNDFCVEPYIHGEKTREEAIQAFKDELASQLENVTIN